MTLAQKLDIHRPARPADPANLAAGCEHQRGHPCIACLAMIEEQRPSDGSHRGGAGGAGGDPAVGDVAGRGEGEARVSARSPGRGDPGDRPHVRGHRGMPTFPSYEASPDRMLRIGDTLRSDVAEPGSTAGGAVLPAIPSKGRSWRHLSDAKGPMQSPTHPHAHARFPVYPGIEHLRQGSVFSGGGGGVRVSHGRPGEGSFDEGDRAFLESDHRVVVPVGYAQVQTEQELSNQLPQIPRGRRAGAAAAATLGSSIQSGRAVSPIAKARKDAQAEAPKRGGEQEADRST